MEKIAVIMSTYNGEKFLAEQLDSILHQENVDVRIVVRDDGSSDGTTAILHEYCDKYPNITVLNEVNAGCKKSFFLAARQAFTNFQDIRYFAFSDQDDVWLPEKLNVGIAGLNKLEKTDPALPYLYFCPPRIVDQSLQPIDKEWKGNHYLNFEEACISQPCAGCTMVFNRQALELFLLGDPDKMSMHDSWIYKTVLACGGQIHEDSTPHILYRQHGNNVIGTGSFSSRWKRRFQNFTGKSRYRSGQVGRILDTYRNYMTPSAIDTATRLSQYKNSGIINKLKIITNPRYRTTRGMHNLLFKTAVLFNRY